MNNALLSPRDFEDRISQYIIDPTTVLMDFQPAPVPIVLA
jgi:hypothetical protein